MRRVDARLLLPAASGWAGAALATSLPAAAGPLVAAAGGGVAAFLTAAILLRRRGAARWRDAAAWRARAGSVAATVALCCAAVLAVAAAAAAQQPQRTPAGLAAMAGHAVTVDGEITGPAQTSRSSAGGGERIAVHATLESVSMGADRVTGRIPVLAFADAGGRQPRIGQRFSAHGVLRQSEPGESIAAFFTVAGRMLPHGGQPAIQAWAQGLRTPFADAAARLDGDGAALLPGLAIGDVSAVSEGLDTAMKASSLSHLTAVSGANCAVVVVLVMLAAGAVGCGRKARAAAALVALGLFVVLVTPQPSVIRAACMAVVVVVATAAGRPGGGVPTLSLAVLVLLAADPWLALQYGFVLSVCATGGLLLLAPPLARLMARWMPRAVALALAVPLAAQLACQPVLILLSPTVPLYGVGANLLAEPAAPVATVLGLIACVALPVAPWLGEAILRVAWCPSAWIAAVARTADSLPGSALPWPAGLLGALLMAAAVAAALYLLLVARGRRDRLRRVIALALTAGCVLYTGVSVGRAIVSRAAPPANWQIAACDIGQGDAIVVRDGGAHALVDLGPDPRLLIQCLHTLGVARIDLLVVTHYDADHVGGLEAVLGQTDLAVVGPASQPRERRAVERLRGSGARVLPGTAGRHGTLGALSWRILWPTKAASAGGSANERGVAVEFSGRGLRSLFLADLDESAQSALLRTGITGQVDVVKVAHHGSADQSEALYRMLAARVGIISAGADNHYGHPTARLLRLLARQRTHILRTDKQGMVAVAPADGGDIAAWAQRTVPQRELDDPGARTGGRRASPAPRTLEGSAPGPGVRKDRHGSPATTDRQSVGRDPATRLDASAAGRGRPDQRARRRLGRARRPPAARPTGAGRSRVGGQRRRRRRLRARRAAHSGQSVAVRRAAAGASHPRREVLRRVSVGHAGLPAHPRRRRLRATAPPRRRAR